MTFLQTTTSLMVFTLAMVLHPYVWKRAQAEIDAVIGTDRLPDFSDRLALPYVDAIIRETVRWVPVVPLSKTIVPKLHSYERDLDTFGLSSLACHIGERCLQWLLYTKGQVLHFQDVHQ